MSCPALDAAFHSLGQRAKGDTVLLRRLKKTRNPGALSR
jgi:hypothetical protein